MDELMIKKISLALFILFSATCLQSAAFAKDKQERVIPETQNIKVKVINLIGGNKHSEQKLEQILLEEASKGWVYNYHVDIDSNDYITKLFVFKRATKVKIKSSNK